MSSPLGLVGWLATLPQMVCHLYISHCCCCQGPFLFSFTLVGFPPSIACTVAACTAGGAIPSRPCLMAVWKGVQGQLQLHCILLRILCQLQVLDVPAWLCSMPIGCHIVVQQLLQFSWTACSCSSYHGNWCRSCRCHVPCADKHTATRW